LLLQVFTAGILQQLIQLWASTWHMPLQVVMQHTAACSTTQQQGLQESQAASD
jgi:hypothetical protein